AGSCRESHAALAEGWLAIPTHPLTSNAKTPNLFGAVLIYQGWFYKLGRVVLALCPTFLAIAESKQAWLCSFGLSKRFCKLSGLKT
ncbi:MAG: hypothetical protein SO365_02780, partial [Prevotella sp.]|nr:hypothetical protein [Prevotella sp.]